jgi:hypothetical protein
MPPIVTSGDEMTLEGYTKLSRAAEQDVIVGRFDHTRVRFVLSMRHSLYIRAYLQLDSQASSF